MPYGAPLPEGDPDDGVERGLLFACFNASIARQFEVVQGWWVDGNVFGLGPATATSCSATPARPTQFMIPGEPPLARARSARSSRARRRVPLPPLAERAALAHEPSVTVAEAAAGSAPSSSGTSAASDQALSFAARPRTSNSSTYSRSGGTAVSASFVDSASRSM